MSGYTDEFQWETAKTRFPVGTFTNGLVTYVAPFGVFIELGEAIVGLLRVPDMAGDNRKEISDYPQIGQAVNGVVIHHDDKQRQIILSQRHGFKGTD